MINCQNANCCVCPNFVSTVAITQVGSTLYFTLPATTNLFNNEKLCVAFAQNVPNLVGIPNLAGIIGACIYPILESQTSGVHLMYADQLKQCNCGVANRQILSLRFSSDVGAFTYVGCRRLCKTNAVTEISESPLSHAVSAVSAVAAVSEESTASAPATKTATK